MSSKKMTYANAKSAVKSLGLNLRAHQGEFIVSIPGNHNRASDYFTNDLEDAVNTARAMAARPKANGPLTDKELTDTLASLERVNRFIDEDMLGNLPRPQAELIAKVMKACSDLVSGYEDLLHNSVKEPTCDCGNAVKGKQRTTKGSHHGTDCALYVAPQRAAGLLTDNEFGVLRALDESEYGEYLCDTLWSFTIADNSKLSGRTISGACSSLVKKGYVRTGNCEGRDTIQPTDEGIQVYLKACDARNVKAKKQVAYNNPRG